MKSKLFDEIKNKLSTDNLKCKSEDIVEKVIDKTYEVIDKTYDYNEVLHKASFIDADSKRLEYSVGTIIYNSTVCCGTSLYKYSDKLSWDKVNKIARDYGKMISCKGKNLNTSYKASVLMALIIQSNIIEDKDDKIRLALDSALYCMCHYAIEYKGIIPIAQKPIRYEYYFPEIEEVIKYIKIYSENTRKSVTRAEYQRGKVEKMLASEFEPLLIYIHKCLVLRAENREVVFNINNGAREYDKMFKVEKPEEKSEKVISNKGIARIFRRKK